MAKVVIILVARTQLLFEKSDTDAVSGYKMTLIGPIAREVVKYRR